MEAAVHWDRESVRGGDRPSKRSKETSQKGRTGEQGQSPNSTQSNPTWPASVRTSPDVSVAGQLLCHLLAGNSCAHFIGQYTYHWGPEFTVTFLVLSIFYLFPSLVIIWHFHIEWCHTIPCKNKFYCKSNMYLLWTTWEKNKYKEKIIHNLTTHK